MGTYYLPEGVSQEGVPGAEGRVPTSRDGGPGAPGTRTGEVSGGVPVSR